MSVAPLQPGQKRIIVCCDGTWLNSDNGFNRKTRSLKQPSNVTRFARAVRSKTAAENPQIAYYQAGVGSSDDFWDQITGGAMGFGLDEHIREAYAFIAQNYVEGDQIILTGFSRGAFTARSIAGLIDTVGLLTRTGMAHFYRIFQDYENMNVPGWNKNPVESDLSIDIEMLPIGEKDLKTGKLLKLARYRDFLLNWTNPKNGFKEPLIKSFPEIAAIGVWDTVGSLGIPTMSWWDEFKILMRWKAPQDDLRFYDTKLAGKVRNAFQALALDEMRYSFRPAVWEKPEGVTTNLKQVWFPGVHSNIGGGEDDQELEDITLAWMMSQIHDACGVEFDEEYVKLVFGPRKPPSALNQDAKHPVEPYRPWACGVIDQKHMPWYYRLAGIHYVRTPGQYFEVDPVTGWPRHASKTNKDLVPLPGTNERVHSSVRIRLVRGEKLGIDNKGVYKAEALTPHPMSFLALKGRKRHGWVVEKVKPESEDDADVVHKFRNGFPKDDTARFMWRAKNDDEERESGRLVSEGGFPRVMIEDVLGVYERMLMERDGKLGEFWEKIPERFAA